MFGTGIIGTLHGVLKVIELPKPFIDSCSISAKNLYQGKKLNLLFMKIKHKRSIPRATSHSLNNSQQSLYFLNNI
jgi:hypothetical protein